MKKSHAKKVNALKKEAEKLKRDMIRRAADMTAKENEFEKSARMNVAVSSLVKAVQKGKYDEELKALRKILPRSVRVHVIEGKIDVFHDCDFSEVPLQLRFAATYAEQQLKGGLALRTKDFGKPLTKHKVKSNEPRRAA